MGLFDKIKGNDEEVELRPPAGSGSEERLRPDDTEEAAAEAEDDDRFLLPGMEPSGETEDDASRDASRDRSGSGTSRSRRSRDSRDAAADGEKMQRIIDQNERIIELLEDIAGGDESDSIWG